MPDLTTYNMAKEIGARKDAFNAAVLATATTAQLTNIAHAVNTTGKYLGKQVVNTTTGILVLAAGAGAGAAWNNCGTGAVAHTPA